MKLSHQKFNLLCDLLKVSQTTRTAMHLHLNLNETKADACRASGCLPTNLTRALKSLERLHNEIRVVYK